MGAKKGPTVKVKSGSNSAGLVGNVTGHPNFVYSGGANFAPPAGGPNYTVGGGNGTSMMQPGNNFGGAQSAHQNRMQQGHPSGSRNARQNTSAWGKGKRNNSHGKQGSRKSQGGKPNSSEPRKSYKLHGKNAKGGVKFDGTGAGARQGMPPQSMFDGAGAGARQGMPPPPQSIYAQKIPPHMFQDGGMQRPNLMQNRNFQGTLRCCCRKSWKYGISSECVVVKNTNVREAMPDHMKKTLPHVFVDAESQTQSMTVWAPARAETARASPSRAGWSRGFSHELARVRSARLELA